MMRVKERCELLFLKGKFEDVNGHGYRVCNPIVLLSYGRAVIAQLRCFVDGRVKGSCK